MQYGRLLMIGGFLTAFCGGVVWAQAGGTGKLGKPAAKPPAAPPKPTAGGVRPPGSSKARPTPVPPKTTPGYSALTVVAAANAKVFLESSDKTTYARQVACQVPSGDRSCTVNELKPGRYQVTVELEDYELAAGQSGGQWVTLAPSRVANVEFDLRPVTYSVTLKTNMKTGRVEYGLRGDSKTVQDVQNGAVVLAGLSPGNYEVELRTQETGFQPLKTVIKVGKQSAEYTLNLERRLSDQPLSANWANLELWEMPATWTTAVMGGATQKKLLAKGAGVALPRNEHLRHYQDFDLVADVSMTNEIGVSLALRAQDKRNYYLIQVTGRQADAPYVLRGFIVKDGVAKPLPTAYLNVNAYAERFLRAQFFELTIRCEGNKFKVFLGDTLSGDPLGGLEDPDNLFPAGAPGIAIHQQEQQEIARFVVTVLKANAP